MSGTDAGKRRSAGGEGPAVPGPAAPAPRPTTFDGTPNAGGAIDELLRRHAAHEHRLPLGGARPTLQVALLLCMDARIQISRVFGLRAGEAHVLRNAGAVVTPDVLRSLLLSQALLGTREVMVVKHTRCGLLGVKEQELQRQVQGILGTAPPFPLHPFDDLVAEVRRDCRHLARSPLLLHTGAIRGFVYDVDNGTLTEVEDATR